MKYNLPSMGALPLFTGLGGGTGGCLVPWEVEVGPAHDDS